MLPIHLFCPVAGDPNVIVDPDDVALRAASVWKSRRITNLRIAALRPRAVNIHQMEFATARWELHPTQSAAKTDINRLPANQIRPSRRAVQVRRAGPKVRIFAIGQPADLKNRRVAGMRE